MTDEIYAAVRRNLLEILPDLEPDQLADDRRSLAELGCNSVDRADVVITTMEDLGIEVPVTEFQHVEDVRGLVELLGRYR
jgi:polyketide biosynthesis acyl carrier protein